MPAAVLAAVDGYRNPDGGYGWGLEPDLRSRTSQPGGALHAFEVFADIAPATTGGRPSCATGWTRSPSPDGGLPFALPVPDPAACAPFWAAPTPTESSLQITAIVAATAHRVAAADPAVAGHPWLARATEYCLAAVRDARARAARDGCWPSPPSCSTPPPPASRRPPTCRAISAARARRRAAARDRRRRGRVHAAARLRAVPRRAGPDAFPRTWSRPSWTAWPTASSPTAAGPSTSPATPPRPPWSGAGPARSRRSSCSAPTACSDDRLERRRVGRIRLPRASHPRRMSRASDGTRSRH